MQCHYAQTAGLNYGNMNKLIKEIADRCIEEIDEHIENTIHWQLDYDDETNKPQIDLTELEFKIKQQILFSLIKRVTK